MALYDSLTATLAPSIAKVAHPHLITDLVSTRTIRIYVAKLVASDARFIVAALALVTILVALHARSIFLAFAAIIQVVLAAPLALVVYSFILGRHYFSALHIFALYLLAGIAADDVFIFTDAWRQIAAMLPEGATLEDRMRLTFQRAAKAIFVTSVTTAAAFLVMATSPIMPISTFGVWAATLILAQYLFVLTIYPCVLVLWEQHVRHRSWFSPFRRCIPKLESREEDVAPQTFNEEATTHLPKHDAQELVGIDRIDRDDCMDTRVNVLQRNGEESDDLNVTELQVIELFFYQSWTKLLHRLRYFLIILAVLCLVAHGFLISRLQQQPGMEKLLPKTHPIAEVIRIFDEEFRATSNSRLLQVYLTWGVSGIDRTGTSTFDREFLGKPIMDNTFDLKPAAAQWHIYNLCERLANDSELVATDLPYEDRIVCWLSDFLEWRRSEGRGDFETYTADVGLMYDVLAFGTQRDADGRQPYLKHLTEQNILLSQDLRRVVGSEIRVMAPVAKATSPEKMQSVVERWETECGEINAGAPLSARGVIATAGDWWASHELQRVLIRSMVMGIVGMAGITMVILTFTTMHPITAGLATVCLCGIVSGVLGFVSLVGWQLGVSESVTSVLGVGYSFDGIAHIATAYTEAKSKDGGRLKRTRFSLGTVGVSILFGSMSTAMSSSVMIAATILLFRKLAILVVVTTMMTLIWSLVFLPASLMVMGPDKKWGPLVRVAEWMRSAILGCCGGRDKRAENGDGGQNEKRN